MTNITLVIKKDSFTKWKFKLRKYMWENHRQVPEACFNEAHMRLEFRNGMSPTKYAHAYTHLS